MSIPRSTVMTDGGGILPAWLIVSASLVYVLLLFGVAYYGDRRAARGRTLVANPWIYALSIAVYCTAWTFYGSVGRAASGGFEYLTIYLGPTLMFALGWVVLRKMIRISKVNRITSIADFISSRYGKSHLLGGLVTIIAVIGIMPYISLQLKAVASSFVVLLDYPEVGRCRRRPGRSCRCWATRRCGSRRSWRCSPSSSAPATSTRPSTTRDWWRRSPSSRWSSWSPSSASGCS